MRKRAAVLFFALPLCGVGLAETWTEGTLSLSWGTPPPPYCAPGQSISVSATANYDPNLPEGTEWYWVDSDYSFSWSFSPDGNCTWSSDADYSTATGSFSDDPADPGGEKTIRVTVELTGEMCIDDGGGTTYDVATAASLEGNVQVVKVDVTFTWAWYVEDNHHIIVLAGGTAGPEGGHLAATARFCADDRDRVRPAQATVDPVSYPNENTDDEWGKIQIPEPPAFFVYIGEGTGIGAGGTVEAALQIEGVRVSKSKNFVVEGSAWGGQ